MKRFFVNLLTAIFSTLILLSCLEFSAYLYLKLTRIRNEQQKLIEQQGINRIASLPTRRLFIVGESAVAGVPFDRTYSMSHYLSKLMNIADQKAIEVINLGIPGRHSFYQREYGDDLVWYKADAVILYAGNNDTMAESNVMRDMPFAKIDLQLLEHSHLYFLLKRHFYRLQKFINKKSGKSIFDLNPNQDQVWTATERFKQLQQSRLNDQTFAKRYFEKGIQDYEANLEALIQYLTKHHIAVFISDLPIVHEATVDYFDWSPLENGEKNLKTESSILNPQEAIKWRELFNKGMEAGRLRHFEDAVKYLEAASALHTDSVPLLNALAQAYAKTGQHYQRKAVLIKKISLALQMRGGHPSKSAALERLAKRYHLPFIRVREAMESLAEHGTVGKNFFLDDCHPNLLGHKLIASAMMETLCQTNYLKCSSNTDWKSWLSKIMEGTVDQRNFAKQYLLTGYYQFKGTVWSQQPDYEGAIYYFEQAKLLAPDNLEIYPLLAATYWKLKKQDKANEALIQLKKLDSEKYHETLEQFPYLRSVYQQGKPY